MSSLIHQSFAIPVCKCIIRARKPYTKLFLYTTENWNNRDRPPLMKFKKTFLLLVTAILSLSAFALTDREQRIADRLLPIGQLCMAGEDCAEGEVASAGPKNPEDVYNTFCMACHLTGATESPILGDIEAWAPRIAKGTDVLYQNAINGFNLMPVKGLCMDCSDDDIIATVDYILERSQ